MMNDHTHNWSKTGTDWSTGFALKGRTLLQCSSCASPYKGRHTGVEQSAPAWNALAERRIELVIGMSMLIVNESGHADRSKPIASRPARVSQRVSVIAFTRQRAIGTRISDSRRPLCRTQQDQQSISLLAIGVSYVVFSRLFAISGLRIWRWEGYGKSAAHAGAISRGCQALPKRRSMAISGNRPAKDPVGWWGGSKNQTRAYTRPDPATQRGGFQKFGSSKICAARGSKSWLLRPAQTRPCVIFKSPTGDRGQSAERSRWPRQGIA
jgi:hypothetical protein